MEPLERELGEMRSTLRSFVARRVGEPDAEDVLQDVLLRAHAGRAGIQDPARLRAWLFQIARNAIVDHHRRARPEDPTESPPEQPASEPEQQERDRAELVGCLRPLIEKLPPRYREIVVLTEVEGLTQEQAAERLGLSVSGAKSRVQRARVRLQELFLTCCEIERDHRGTVVGFERTERTAGFCESQQES